MFYSPQVKWCIIFSTENIVYELPHELANGLRLRILGNTGKISKTGGRPSGQKLRKNRYQSFFVLPNFA